MEEISNAFNNAMDRICSRCIVNQRCKDTKTKCNEWEILSAIRDELNLKNEVEETCYKLVGDIEAKERECIEQGICPYCGGKYEQK